jgi:hypothetical protein
VTTQEPRQSDEYDVLPDRIKRYLCPRHGDVNCRERQGRTDMTDAPRTGGTIVGIIAMAVIGLVCLAGVVIGLLMLFKPRPYESHDRFTGGWLAFWSILALLISAGVYVWAMWPFAYAYHHWIPTRGTVESVSKRIVSDGDNISEKYVLKFTDGRLRAVNDSAAGSLKTGDPVSLRCKKAYDFGVPRSAHGWDCKWAGRRI